MNKKRIEFRVSESEYKKIKKKSQEKGLKVNQYSKMMTFFGLNN